MAWDGECGCLRLVYVAFYFGLTKYDRMSKKKTKKKPAETVVIVGLKVPRRERDQWKFAAKKEDLSLSQYIRRSVRAARGRQLELKK